ncbi:MAG: TlpA disulfide reductase family protein [Bacillota bacterium]
MKQKHFILIILLLSLLLITGCGTTTKDQAQNDQTNTSDTENDTASSVGLVNFQTEDIYGEEKNQDIFKDYSLTLVNVWGTFCGPCLEEMPYLGQLQEEYETKGVNIVGIVVDVQDEDLQIIDEQIDLAKEITTSTGADYTHLIVSEDLIESVLSEFDAIPASFIVDSDGNIVSEFYIGSRSKEDWVTIIEENMAKQ